MLEALGVWPLLASRRSCAFDAMHVWDGEGTAAIDFTAAEVNEPALGHIVENREIVQALVQTMAQDRCCRLLYSAVVADIVEAAGRQRVLLADGRVIDAALVVAADGAQSAIRGLRGFQTREWDYGHGAIVATVATEKPHENTAWQRFASTGPLAFLPLPSQDGQHFCSIVWSTLPDRAAQLMALDESGFNRALAAAFEYRLGAVVASGTRFSFPLRQRHAIDYVQPGVALLGDAAHTIHPLAGQGINLGLADVAVLAEELHRAHRRGLGCGELSVLQRYQRRRKSDNLLMMAAMEGFKRVFEQQPLSLRWLRNTGMRWVDRQPWIKHQLIRQAMGITRP